MQAYEWQRETITWKRTLYFLRLFHAESSTYVFDDSILTPHYKETPIRF
jgi:hypothetical protein